MKKAIIYHNPRCSKSRQAKALLESFDYQIEEIRYLDTPPTADKLSDLCQKMGMKPIEIIRTKESLFKELGLSVSDDREDQAWFEILVKHPKLIERPIVEVGDKAAMGRPPEKIEAIL